MFCCLRCWWGSYHAWAKWGCFLASAKGIWCGACTIPTAPLFGLSFVCHAVVGTGGGKCKCTFFAFFFFALFTLSHFFALFALFCTFFCTCFHCPVRVVFALLMSVTQPEAGAQVHTNDEEEENEPDLLENDSDDDEPKAKKAKTSLNYGAKTTPASRARPYPPSTFEPRGESMWCVACQKPVDYKRKSVADAHLKTPAHKAKAKCKKKVGSKWRNAETKSTILLHSIRIYRYGAPESKGVLRTTSLVSMLRLERIV